MHQVAERQYTFEVLELTSKLLKENPEYYTIWNVRRRLLIYGLFSNSSDSSSPLKDSQNSMPIDTTQTSSVPQSASTSTTPADSSTTQHDPKFQTRGRTGTTLDLITADLEFLF